MSQFRNYYNGRKGTYTICKDCERINSRAKYLERKERSEAEQAELEKIYKLYDAQRRCGLQPPNHNDSMRRITDDLDSMILKYAQRESLPSKEAPIELTKWLTEPLHEDPEYYFEEVYDVLNAKYRPVISVDTVTLLPTYDDTYADILDKILDRFDNYEDEYYSKEENNEGMQ